MFPTIRATFGLAIMLAAPLLGACQAEGPTASTGPDVPATLEPAAVRLSVPDEHPNGPFYSLLGISPFTGALRFPHTEEWGAAPFVRQLFCVPPDFNLLTPFDLVPAFPGGPPRPFLCPSTVAGHLIFANAGPPPSELILSQLHGTGAVPVVFARWSEIELAIADDAITLPELLALPSAMLGSAHFYKETVTTGALPSGQVSFKLVARGTVDGRGFRLHYTESAGNQQRRTQIVIE